MAEDDLIDKLPELLFEGLREQMLLGLLSYDMVETILEPLFTLLDHEPSAMDRLPAELKTDIENILRIYRHIADERDLKPPPSVPTILAELYKEWNRASQALDKSVTHQENARLFKSKDGGDWLGKQLRILKKIASRLPPRTGTYFMTDGDHSVFLELIYEEELDRFCFQSSVLEHTIHVYLWGSYAFTLQPGQERSCLSLEDMFEALISFDDEELIIELREEQGS